MTKPSEYPVSEPILTRLIADRIQAEAEEEGRRELAFPTMFRYSQACGCTRAMAYEHLAQEPSDPPDLASLWRMYLGTLIHEQVQGAILESFGDLAMIEVKSRHGELCSGHADAVVWEHPDLGKVAYELKSVGSYAYEQAVGLDRYKRKIPQGPKMSAKVQGALNATALECDTLIIGLINMESVSIQRAQALDLTVLDRVMSEWIYPKTVFVGWAADELARMAMIEADLEDNLLPEPSAIGDEGEVVKLDPTAERPAWFCTYCRHRTTCIMHTTGVRP